MPNNPNNQDPSEDDFLYNGLHFFGALTASVTHELNNVLGTIDQISGLLEDMTISASNNQKASLDNLNILSEKINRQTERGIALIKRLNTFAHSTDHAAVEFNLSEVVVSLMALMKRLADMQRVEIVVNRSDEDILVKTNSFVFQQVLYLAAKRVLSLIEQKTSMTITVAATDIEKSVTITAPYPGNSPAWPEKAYINLLASKLPGILEEKVGDEQLMIEIMLLLPQI